MKTWMSLCLCLLLMMPIAAIAAPDPGYEEPIQLSVNVIYTSLVEEDARTKFVEDKFNLDLQFIACSTNDIAEKSRLWIAGGDMPDVMWTSFGANAVDLVEFAGSGLLLPFPDLENYPNLKAIQDALSITVTKNAELCGGSYYYWVDTGYAELDLLNFTGWYYRRDWAEKVGLLNDNDTYTWEEMLALAKAFVDQDPGNNGTGNTIGITSIGNQYPSFYGITQMSPKWTGFVEIDGHYVWGASLPETLEGLKMVKRAYDEGLLWDEQLMAQDNDGPNKFFAGLAGICADNWHVGRVTTMVGAMAGAFPDLDLIKAVSPMKLLSPDGTMYTNRIPGYWGNWSFSKSIGEKELMRFMDMMEYLASPEGQRLGAIGVPGVDYVINDSGTVELLWSKDETGAYVSPFVANAHRFVTFPSLAEGYALRNPATNVIAAEMANRHMDMIQTEEGRYINETDADLTFLDTPKYKALALSTTPADKAKELIVISSDIEADWNAYIADMMPQIDPVLEEINAALGE